MLKAAARARLDRRAARDDGDADRASAAPAPTSSSPTSRGRPRALLASRRHEDTLARPRSARLFARAQKILPGGVDSPVRAFKAVGGDPLFITAAQGRAPRGRRRQHLHRLRDVVGPADPRPRAARPGEGARRRGAKLGTSYGAPTELEVKLGEQVRALMPSMERVRFVSSGTEAAMSAVRVARAATGRDAIIKFEGCYHGHADPFLVKAGSGAHDARHADQPGRAAQARAATRCSPPTTTSPRCERLCETQPQPDRRAHRRADRRQHGRRAAGRRVPGRAARAVRPRTACC